MKNNHERAFHSQNSTMLIMNSVRHLNKLKSLSEKIAHLAHLKRFKGAKFVETLLSIPELDKAAELRLHA